MGAIYHHNIEEYINEYNLKFYIETGTGAGECLEYCKKFNFEECISIEIHDKIFEIAKQKFKNDTKCKLFLGNSFEVLENILKYIKGNSLFFLDAHFPGADFGYNDYSAEKDINLRLPLKKEIETIIKHYPLFNSSVFIIDDLRIYEDNNYTDGNWKDRKTLGQDGIDFIFDFFEKTHNISRDLRYQGFLILKPKKTI